ncbi:MAG: hypothetical protein Barrevirus3_4 [Barrevirus sp.]|uniref:Uncharacterized protein n=1 Tax=Barrevirus sp. TaxID=2487763 RepID=A0A3G4ZRC4_9VIRU|nr:MAG: hypothetical protein Barrevirus3_4 [Barrevirus sp.]
MKHNCSSKCSNCQILKQKLDLYENFLKDVKDLDINTDNNSDLRESMIIEKDNYGNINKKIRSELGESFLLIDKGKNIGELDKREQNVILEQDSYHNYQNGNEYLKKLGSLYTVAYYGIKVGKWLLLL